MIYTIVKDHVKDMLSPRMTASWEKGLSQIENGEITQEKYIGILNDYVKKHVEAIKGAKAEQGSEQPRKEYEIEETNFKCPKCGKKLVLNNVYAGRYDEKGYLKTWTEYQNWLQNTLNHKMVLLEIGEGNRFPTIIRFPFERIALFQQKADLYCIDGEQNPIAWLLSLC